MPTKWTGVVEGAKGLRTYEDPDGQVGYAIWKQDARLAASGLSPRVQLRLGVITAKEAVKKLNAFEDDPVAFVQKHRAQVAVPGLAAKPASLDPIYIEATLIGPFLKYLKEEQGLSPRYIDNVGFYLGAWGKDLAGRDLRGVEYQELLQVLASYPKTDQVLNKKTGKLEEVIRAPARKHRISALKTLTGYLRGHLGTLKPSDDPTMALEVPQGEPEKVKRAKAKKKRKGYEMADLEALYGAINGWESAKYGLKGTGKKVDVQCVRDAILIHCKTGLHGTELERLAKGEDGDVKVLKGQGEIAATITFLHKKGKMHVQSIDKQTLGAVQRLQARKSAPAESYIKSVVRKALLSLGKDPHPDKDGIRIGELRHSVVTWGIEAGQKVYPKKGGGLSLEDMASIVGHESTRMTDTRYNNTQVPAMLKLPLKLEHSDDPKGPLQLVVKGEEEGAG